MKDIVELLERCVSINEIALELNGYCNGYVIKKVKGYIYEYGYEDKFLLNAEEKYNKSPKKCKNCSDVLCFDKRFNDFCSSKCSAIYNNKLREPYSDELKEKISISLKKYFYPKKIEKIKYEKIKCKKIEKTVYYIEMSCIICGEKFQAVRRGKYNGNNKTRKTCSIECNSILKSNNSKNHMRISVLNGTHKGWMSRNTESYPETFFKKVLENNNIKYEFNKPISKRSLGLDCDHSYFLDFYIVDKNIDLEIDGKQHNLPERIESDIIRNNALIESGINVYRIEWKNINSKNGKEYIKNEIDNFLDYYKNI